MAQLTLIVTLETTEEYDLAVVEDRRFRSKGEEGPTVADRLGQQVARVISGLKLVEKAPIDVVVTTVVSGHRAQRKDLEAGEQAVPSVINDTPSEKSEKRKAG